MVKIIEHPDGTREFIVDRFEARAAEYLSAMGAKAPQLTQEQFEELVAQMRRAWEEAGDDDEDDEEEDDGMTPEERAAEAKRQIRAEFIAMGREDLFEESFTFKEES